MRTPALPSPRRIAAGAGLALLAAGLTPIAAAPANAASTGLIINEVYGGGGSTSASAAYKVDFVELFNPTATAKSLNGMSLQYRSGAYASGAPSTLALPNVTVPANSTYLVQTSPRVNCSGAVCGGGELPTPDFEAPTGSVLNMSGTGGQVILADVTTGITATGTSMHTVAGVVDFVGYGSTPTSYETNNTGTAVSTTTSVSRVTAVDNDNNRTDFAAPATPTPTAATPAAPGSVEATSPGDKSGQVGQAIAPFTLGATGGTSPYTWTATGLPTGLAISAAGQVSGTPTETGTFNVVATATDSASPAATDDVAFTYTITAASAVIPIAQIQGTGATSPVAGQNVSTQGVVTASYPTGGLNGFYIQTPGADTANASDAIFVYGGVSGFTTYPAVGDSVAVSGQAAEFSGATQIVASDAGVSPVTALGTVTPKTVIPGTDCVLPGTDCLSGAALDDAREVAEGELFKPTAPWTATDVYDGGPFYSDGTNSSAFRGELGVVANSTKPLVAPTEVIDAQATALVAERKKYNDAHRIILDDASSLTYSTTQNSDKPFPWFTATHTVRVGSAITFPKPVVFTFGFNAWRILPQAQVVGDSTGTIDFSQTRPAAPENVGGDLKLATFNVLNFFPTTGEEFVASGGTCSYFRDRDGNNISNNSCNPNGPRGAANAANLQRQRDKIVAAITTADADIVSLEELENSVKFGKNRDFAINELVSALNAASAPGTWAAVPSASILPATADQDVIRNGFIYQPANVALVGESVVLSTQSSTGGAFEDAREPLAQAFKKVGTPDSRAFAVIVNHFKSKGSGTPDPDGQGNANDRRKIQANALVTFANDFKTLRGITRVFLAGDFNAYTEEDPIQILEAAGYTSLDSSSNPDEETYNFDGQVGSLDHVLANGPALADVNAVDVWDINGYESVYYEYSRFNSNITNLYTANQFRSSDHSPEIVGINTAVDPNAPVDVQILATNDFHGRIANDPASAAAGAAAMAGAVKALRQTNPNTVFAAAGDLIGASTFESFIDNDKPTIDALNSAGLEVSAAGNHEFDQGYNDLVNRVMAPYNATTNPQGGANWEYIAANVKLKADGADALTPSWTKTMNGVEVGFVGAVTEHLPELVTPGGIAQIEVTDIVTAVNAEATKLKAEGADVVVMLVHEGSDTTTCAQMAANPSSDFGSIITGVNDNVDAIVSGHTHLEYNCSFVVPGWSSRPVKERPVVSAGQYGAALNRIVFTVDPTTGAIQDKTQSVIKLKTANGGPFTYTPDAATQTIVDAAVAKAAVLGARPLGKISAPFNRAKFADGTTENRGGESTLGNLVAEIQRWATRGQESGAAQIAFMNPGGLRTDLPGGITGESAYPKTVTYKQAANVQPFANTLVNMDLTGSQIKATLEQQWQAAGAARPFLKLGMSKGFNYTYDPSKTQGNRIQKMWLNGTEINPATVYSVTVNSFLATGGDGFTALNGGAGKQDTGKSDLQAQVDYFSEFANAAEGDEPLPIDYKQQAVGVKLPVAAPSSYAIGEHVVFDLTSLSMTDPLDVRDSQVAVELGGFSLGTFPVTTTLSAPSNANSNDEAGTASVDVALPPCSPIGAATLVVTGTSTGTEIQMPITITGTGDECLDTTVTGTDITLEEGTAGTIPVQVAPATATGEVILGLGQMTLETTLTDGKGAIQLAAGALPVGVHKLPLSYTGDKGHAPSTGSVTVTVKAKPSAPGAVDTTVSATAASFDYGTAGSVAVKVAPTSSTGTVTLSKGAQVLGSTTLSSGAGTVALAQKSLPAGTHTLTVSYSGDAGHKASTGSVTVVVNKAESTVTAKLKNDEVVVHKTRAKIVVKVHAKGFTPTGKVQIRVAGKTYRATLEDGRAVIKLKAFDKAGTYKAKVSYVGDDNTEADTTKVKIKVTRS